MRRRRRANNKKNDRVAESAPISDRRYGAIGISAVAAALRYQSDAKNPAYAPGRRRSVYERGGRGRLTAHRASLATLQSSDEPAQ